MEVHIKRVDECEVSLLLTPILTRHRDGSPAATRKEERVLLRSKFFAGILFDTSNGVQDSVPNFLGEIVFLFIDLTQWGNKSDFFVRTTTAAAKSKNENLKDMSRDLQSR
jgi:hypothetical protein